MICFGLFVWKKSISSSLYGGKLYFCFEQITWQRMLTYAITWSSNKWMEIVCNMLANVASSKLQQWNVFAFPARNVDWWCTKGACPWSPLHCWSKLILKDGKFVTNCWHYRHCNSHLRYTSWREKKQILCIIDNIYCLQICRRIPTVLFHYYFLFGNCYFKVLKTLQHVCLSLSLTLF